MRYAHKICIALLLITLTACGDKAEKARKELAAQGIPVNEEGFIGQVEKGNAANVTLFFAAGIQPGVMNKAGTPAIVAAMTSGNPETLQLVLDHIPAGQGDAALVNQPDGTGRTALSLAAQRGDDALIKTLAAKGASPFVLDHEQFTPLHYAAQKNHLSTAQLLIQLDAAANQDQKPRAVNFSNNNAETPLLIAVRAKNADMVKLLLSQGANPDIADRRGYTPLMAAVETGNQEVAGWLLDTKARIDLYDIAGMTSLKLALSRNDVGMVNMLIKRGADVDFAKEGDTLPIELVLTAKPFNIDLFNTLHKLSKKSDSVAGNLLFDAVDNNQADVVTILLARGMDPNSKDSDGKTLAEVAVYKGYPEVLEMLMNKGAGVKLDYAILWSIIDGKGKAVPVLLKQGANPNVLSQQGDPALWLAVSASEIEAVEALLKYKAFPNVVSQRLGNSALGLASYIGNVDMIRLLIDAGAQPDMADKFGVTPLGYAASQARMEAVAFLLQKGANAKHTDKLGRSIQDLANSAQAASDKKEKIAALLAAAPVIAPKPAP